jgi:hypothetical protein
VSTINPTANAVNLAWIKCARKRAFRSRKDALEHGKFIGRTFGSKLKTYVCDHCGRWHLFTDREKK